MDEQKTIVVDGMPVDINNASVEALCTSVSGIGPALAGRIAAYRTEHGPFATIFGLIQVRGFDARLVEMISNQITVQAPEDSSLSPVSVDPQALGASGAQATEEEAGQAEPLALSSETHELIARLDDTPSEQADSHEPRLEEEQPSEAALPAEAEPLAIEVPMTVPESSSENEERVELLLGESAATTALDESYSEQGESDSLFESPTPSTEWGSEVVDSEEPTDNTLEAAPESESLDHVPAEGPEDLVSGDEEPESEAAEVQAVEWSSVADEQRATPDEEPELVAQPVAGRADSEFELAATPNAGENEPSFSAEVVSEAGDWVRPEMDTGEPAEDSLEPAGVLASAGEAEATPDQGRMGSGELEATKGVDPPPPQPPPPPSGKPPRSFWASLGLVLLGGLLGVALTLVAAIIWSGTFDFAPRRDVDALSRNLGTLNTNGEMAWQRIDELALKNDELGRRMGQLEGLAERVDGLEQGLIRAESDLADTKTALLDLSKGLEDLNARLETRLDRVDASVKALDGRMEGTETRLGELAKSLAALSEAFDVVKERVAQVDTFFLGLRDLLFELEGSPSEPSVDPATPTPASGSARPSSTTPAQSPTSTPTRS